MASTTIEGVCNAALTVIGYERSIGNLYEGSEASIVALQHWSHVRDTLLYSTEPIWAHEDAPLTLVKSAPNIVNGTADYSGGPWNPATNPSLPWLYEYAWPANCLKPLQIKVTPNFIPIWRPQYKPLRMIFDVQTDSRTLLTNQDSAILNYIAQILDPNDWHVNFLELMIQALAQRFETEFGKKPPPQQQQGGQGGGNAPR